MNYITYIINSYSLHNAYNLNVMKKFLFIIFFYMQKWQLTIIKKHKEKLWKEARERYQNLSEEKKEKKCQ